MTFTIHKKTKPIPGTGWIDSSPQPEKHPELRQYMPDEEYFSYLRWQEPVFRFIVQNFKIDPNNCFSYLKYPIVRLGFHLSPMAIELSHWNYPVTLLVREYTEYQRVRANSKRHDGFIKNVGHYDFLTGTPESRIIIWVDDGSLRRDRIKEYIAYLEERCQVLIVAIIDGPDRKEILGNKTIKNKYGEHVLAIIS